MATKIQLKQDCNLDLTTLSSICKIKSDYAWSKKNTYTVQEFYEFASYVLRFYNSKDGLYPFNCSNDVIIECCMLVMLQSDIYVGDSLDREQVRRVLEAFGNRELTPSELEARNK